MDSYFDPNERKYYITLESVELAIAEEKAKAAKIHEPSEPVGNVRNDPERADDVSEPDNDQVKELERENLDLKITRKSATTLLTITQRKSSRCSRKVFTGPPSCKSGRSDSWSPAMPENTRRQAWGGLGFCATVEAG